MSGESKKQPVTLHDVASGWAERDDGVWRRRPDLFLTFGERALELGDPVLGFDILDAGARDAFRR